MEFMTLCFEWNAWNAKDNALSPALLLVFSFPTDCNQNGELEGWCLVSKKCRFFAYLICHQGLLHSSGVLYYDEIVNVAFNPLLPCVIKMSRCIIAEFEPAPYKAAPP